MVAPWESAQNPVHHGSGDLSGTMPSHLLTHSNGSQSLLITLGSNMRSAGQGKQSRAEQGKAPRADRAGRRGQQGRQARHTRKSLSSLSKTPFGIIKCVTLRILCVETNHIGKQTSTSRRLRSEVLSHQTPKPKSPI